MIPFLFPSKANTENSPEPYESFPNRVKKAIRTFAAFHKLNLTVIFLYFLFTLLFTFPLFLRISTSTPFADGHGDQFQSMWMFWWFKTAVFNLTTNPLYTNFLYYPHGSSLIYHMPIFLSLLSLPIQHLFCSQAGLIICHNLILIFTFVFSGFGVYLLVRYLTNDPLVAFVCGLIFAFSSYRLWNLNHLNLLSTEWIPFYILYLIRSVDEKSLRNSLWAGAFFVFTFLSDFTCALFLAFFTLIYLVFALIRSRKQLLDRRVIRNSCVALFIVIVILSPFLYSLSSTKIDWQPRTSESIMYSANLAGYLMPVKERSLLGSSFLPSKNRYNGVGGEQLFLGYTLLFLVLYTLIKLRKVRIKLWFFSALAFLLLSLGQAIHIYDHTYDFKWLPYNLIYTYVPLFQIGRTPGRFSLMVNLCFVIFSGYGLNRLFNSAKTYQAHLSGLKDFLKGFLARRGMPILVVLLICIEFIKIPIPLIGVEVPECYQKIRDIHGEYAILEVPASFTGTALIANVYMFYQTVHEKRVVNGSLTRPSYHATDFLNEFSAKQKIKLDSTFIDKLARNDVKYLIIHEYKKSLQGKLECDDDTSYCVFKEKSSSIRILQTF
jgi:hypothetical protein